MTPHDVIVMGSSLASYWCLAVCSHYLPNFYKPTAKSSELFYFKYIQSNNYQVISVGNQTIICFRFSSFKTSSPAYSMHLTWAKNPLHGSTSWSCITFRVSTQGVSIIHQRHNNQNRLRMHNIWSAFSGCPSFKTKHLWGPSVVVSCHNRSGPIFGVYWSDPLSVNDLFVYGTAIWDIVPCPQLKMFIALTIVVRGSSTVFDSCWDYTSAYDSCS